MLLIAILFVFACMLISLFAGLYFLFFPTSTNKHAGLSTDKKVKDPLLTSLSFRIGLAGIFILLLLFGLVTGQLGHNAPWSTKANASSTDSQNINKEK